MSVIVTDTAAREISSILSQQGLDSSTTHLRIGVKGGGCSGFNYILDLTETKKEGDEQWDFDFELEGEPFTLQVNWSPRQQVSSFRLRNAYVSHEVNHENETNPEIEQINQSSGFTIRI